MISEEKYNQLLKENKILERKYKEKQRQFNALADYLKVKFEYSDRRIFNIIERFVKKTE